MVSDDLIKYIKDVRKQGHKDETIVEHLKNFGYEEPDIDEAFEKLNKKLDKLLLVMGGLVGLGVLLLVISIGLNVDLKQEETLGQCDEYSISLFKYQDKSIFCHIIGDTMNIQIPIENTGQAEISKLKVEVTGEKATDRQENSGLVFKPGEIFPKVINHEISKSGNLKRIIIVPVGLIEGEELDCDDKSLIIESITCD